MSESNAALVRRLSRLLKEELQARGIGFALLLVIPSEDTRSHLGITGNIDVGDMIALLAHVRERLMTDPNIKLVDADDRIEGHA